MKSPSLVINNWTHLYVCKGLDGRFSPQKVFVVGDETLGFSLPGLLVNPALAIGLIRHGIETKSTNQMLYPLGFVIGDRDLAVMFLVFITS